MYAHFGKSAYFGDSSNTKISENDDSPNLFDLLSQWFLLEHNPELLYNVLHQRVNLVKLRGKSGLADYIDNIELVNGFFSGHLKLNEGQHGPILNMEDIQARDEHFVKI